MAGIRPDKSSGMDPFSVREWECIDRLVAEALDEDMGPAGDVTTASVLDESATGKAEFVAKASGILAGLPVTESVFKKVDRGLQCAFEIKDGDAVGPDHVFGTVRGRLSAILAAERTALNFLQRLSGIASLTDQFVRRVKGTGARIVDTRKTTPGLRLMEKYAVRVGGGDNHRFGLYDMVLIKNNHVDAAGGIGPALERCFAFLRKTGAALRVEVETRTLDEVRRALAYPVHRIMFDNMDVEQIREGVRLVNGKAETEASGRVRLDNVRGIAETGVGFISVGCLTHSAPALDISLHALT